MESVYFAIALGLGVFNLMLLALVASLRAEINRKDAARAEWWDAYPSLLDENARAHSIIACQRDAHEELQRAFLAMVRTGRAA